MTFIHLYNRGINLLRNNLGKTLIVGNTTLFLGYDSYKFRKETSPKNAIDMKSIEEQISDFVKYKISKGTYKPDKLYITYDNNSTYSQFMKPIRKIKDYNWINKIHQSLIEYNHDMGYRINRTIYKKFLSDFPYQDNIYYNKVFLDSNKVSEQWLIDEFYYFDVFSHQFSGEIQNILTTYTEKKFSKHNPNFAKNLLETELKRHHLIRNNKIIMWCFQEAIQFNLNILRCVEDEYMNKCDDYFFVPDNLKGFGNQYTYLSTPAICDLLSYEYYLQRLNKIKPDYITSFLNRYYGLFDELYDTKNHADYNEIHKFVNTITTNMTLKDIILNKFNDLYLPIKSEVIFIIMKNTDKYTDLENKIISDFFKNDDYLNEYIKKYAFISLETLNEILFKFTDKKNTKQYISDLIVSGKYQIKGDNMEKIPDYVLENMDNTKKLLMNQHKLNINQIEELVIKYEKYNRELTSTELMIFIKKYQPKFFEKIIGSTLS